MIGGTVHDLGPGASAAVAEIEALVDEVLELLGEPQRAEKAATDGES